MPAVARAKEAPTKLVSLEDRIRQRAYELYLQRCGHGIHHDKPIEFVGQSRLAKGPVPM
jgi:hypothetical protein